MLKFLNKGISTPIAITIIVVFAIILVGGALAYQYYWPQAEENNRDETADWQTYKNEQYGFEVKYPKSLYAYEDKISGNLETISTLTQGQLKNLSYKEDYGLIWINYFNDKTLDEYYNLLVAKPNKDNFLTQQIDMGGSIGYKIYYHEQIFSKENITAFYIVSDKNKKGVISFSVKLACDKEKICENYAEEFNQVISTFKFTK
jgi:hypothetical protein